MGWLADAYERHLFPHLLEWGMRGMNDLREETLVGAEGEVLELGFGTGLNLRYYPPGVERLSTVDPMDSLEPRVRRRIESAPFPVERHHLPADGQLPFDAGRFDCITVTWTLCTIPDPVAALVEARRVLRPGGLLLFIEHGRSDDPGVARWQDRWNPIQKVVACGCNVNRRIDRIVEDGGFAIEKLDRFEFSGAPRLFNAMYRGRALAPA